MEAVQDFASAVWEEVSFWSEVLVEAFGLHKTKYHYMVEAHEREVKEAQRQEDIQIRRASYQLP